MPANEVLADLLRWSAGKFAFTAQEPLRSSARVHDTEQLLGDARLLVEEWDDLQALVPSLDHRVALVSALPTHTVKFDAARWSWLIAIGGGCTVRELAAALDVTELGVLRVVRTLLGLGVATVSPPSPPELLTTRGHPSARSIPRRTNPARGNQRILGRHR